MKATNISHELICKLILILRGVLVHLAQIKFDLVKVSLSFFINCIVLLLREHLKLLFEWAYDA